MSSRRPPETDTGYYVLHDFRTIDWAAWGQASEADRETAVSGLTAFLAEEATAEGDLACFSVLGHDADLLVLVLRPAPSGIDTYQRQFEQLAFAKFTSRTHSAVGVTEASGYTDAAGAYFDPDRTADPGIERYMETRLYPEIPDTAALSYYPMSKRRTPAANWYDLSYEERAEHVRRHGEIGKAYAGEVTQLITGTIGFEEWEWGVTLFADDLTAVKALLTEMRFDPSTSIYAEFGPFFVARRFPIEELDAFMAGEPIPTDPGGDAPSIAAALADLPIDPGYAADTWVVLAESSADREAVAGAVTELSGNFEHYDSHRGTAVTEADGHVVVVSGWQTEQAAGTAAGFLAELPGVTDHRIGQAGDPGATPGSTGDDADTDVRDLLAEEGIYAGQPHGEDLHALVVYSSAPPAELSDPVAALRAEYADSPSHEDTRVYHAQSGERTAVVSLWTTADAAAAAADDLAALPGVESRPAETDGFGTMGMFYTVKPGYREAFLDTFADVTTVVEGLDGHRETELLVNVDEERDMFIASRWDSKEDAMAFFRSDAFSDTVEWGRDVLADRPRHVFLA